MKLQFAVIMKYFITKKKENKYNLITKKKTLSFLIYYCSLFRPFEKASLQYD